MNLSQFGDIGIEKSGLRLEERFNTLSVSTSLMISSMVASSPIPYCAIVCLSSSLAINLQKVKQAEMRAKKISEYKSYGH